MDCPLPRDYDSEIREIDTYILFKARERKDLVEQLNEITAEIAAVDFSIKEAAHHKLFLIEKIAELAMLDVDIEIEVLETEND